MLYKWLHYRHSPPAVEVALGLAMAYATYLGTGEGAPPRQLSCLNFEFELPMVNLGLLPNLHTAVPDTRVHRLMYNSFCITHHSSAPPSLPLSPAPAIRRPPPPHTHTEYYLHGSGVIGVVVYGLYGAATTTYSLSSTARRGGAFQKFWEPLCFVANGAVFFFAGSSIVNFAIR